MSIRRKSVKDWPRINNCRVEPTCFARLNRIAGERGMGSAIEDLCKREALVLRILESGVPPEQQTEAARVILAPVLGAIAEQ